MLCIGSEKEIRFVLQNRGCCGGRLRMKSPSRAFDSRHEAPSPHLPFSRVALLHRSSPSQAPLRQCDEPAFVRSVARCEWSVPTLSGSLRHGHLRPCTTPCLRHPGAKDSRFTGWCCLLHHTRYILPPSVVKGQRRDGTFWFSFRFEGLFAASRTGIVSAVRKDRSPKMSKMEDRRLPHTCS